MLSYENADLLKNKKKKKDCDQCEHLPPKRIEMHTSAH